MNVSCVRKLTFHLFELHEVIELGSRIWHTHLSFARVASPFAFTVEVALALIHQPST